MHDGCTLCQTHDQFSYHLSAEGIPPWPETGSQRYAGNPVGVEPSPSIIRSGRLAFGHPHLVWQVFADKEIYWQEFD